MTRWMGLSLIVLLASAAEGKDPPKPTIVFLDAEQASVAIADESVEPYFSLLQPAEMEAKTGGVPLEATGLAAQREECKTRYAHGVRGFSEAEQRALTTLVERLHGAWAASYPLLADLPWSFLGTTERVEGGLPHTRGRSIVIPRSVGTAMVASLTSGEAAVREQLELLAHEQCHVLQRLQPTLFTMLYMSWGFLHAEGLGPDAKLLHRHVVNPDGVRTEWVFPLLEADAAVFLHPLVAFRDAPPPYAMPAHLEMIAVELVKSGSTYRAKLDAQGALTIRPLQSVRGYVAHFGGIFECFHPNEIFAVLFAAMVMKDSFGGPGLARPSAAVGKDFHTLRAWAARNLWRRAAARVR